MTIKTRLAPTHSLLALLLALPPLASAYEEFFLYDEPDVAVSATMLDDANQYDADVASHGDLTRIAWLEFVPGQGDHLWTGVLKNGSLRSKRRHSSEPGDFANPTLVRDETGRWLLSYEAGRADGWRVEAIDLSDLEPETHVQPPIVFHTDVPSIHHQVASAAGETWFVWQAVRLADSSDTNGAKQFDVLARRLGSEETVVVGEGPFGDWHPSVAVSGQVVCVVWDAYDGQSYDVLARVLHNGRPGPTLEIASTPAFEGRAQVAAGPDGRFWIAWEEGAEHWGKTYRAQRGITEHYVAPGDSHGPLHRHRKVRVAVLTPDGSLSSAPDLPTPATDRAIADKGSPLGSFYERAELAVDGMGRPWIAYRHYDALWMGLEPYHHVEGGWRLYARCLTRDSWSRLFGFDIDQGDGLQRLSVTPSQDGIRLAWTTGRTDRRTNERPRGIAFAVVSEVGSAPGEQNVSRELPTRDHEKTSPPAMTKPLAGAGDTYRLHFGDLHRHTDLSLCFVPCDGSIDDAYRYAIDVARLDFLGITDHARDLALGNALSQIWWRTRKEVTRHELAGTFVPFFAYERSRGETDHNVISLRDDMLRPHIYAHSRFWKELDDATITIPHQPFNKVLWNERDDRARPLLEIFQGFRDTSVEKDAHEGLSLGHRVGFIASSDHLSTSASYACVWAEERSRVSIFESLKARRTYGATAKIEVAAKLNGRWMGEISKRPVEPRLRLAVRGSEPIERIDIVLDGKISNTIREFPNPRNSFELDRKIEIPPRTRYLYLHIVRTDGNEAWTSPWWFEY